MAMTSVGDETAYLEYLPRFGGNHQLAKAFYAEFRNRKVFIERKIDLSHSDYAAVQRKFEENQWTHFLQEPEGVAIELVREFYSLIPKEIGKSLFYFPIGLRGVLKYFSADLIAQVLRLPRKERCVEDIKTNRIEVFTELSVERRRWEKSEITFAEMKHYYRALSQIVSANVHPRIHKGSLSYKQAKVIYLIGKGIEFDVPKYMFNLIVDATKNPTYGLPYGAAITKILVHEGFPIWVNEDIRYSEGPINEAEIKTKAKKRIVDTQAVGTSNAIPPRIEVGESSQTGNELENLNKKIDAIQANLVKIEAMVTFCYEKLSRMPDTYEQSLGSFSGMLAGPSSIMFGGQNFQF